MSDRFRSSVAQNLVQNRIFPHFIEIKITCRRAHGHAGRYLFSMQFDNLFEHVEAHQRGSNN